MATKTISLAFDAYQKLKEAGESFSQVVRRAQFAVQPVTGTDLRTYFKSGGSKITSAYLDGVEEAIKQDTLPENP
jgi:hypothetical protein